jgi:hypothetical protein
MDGSGQFSIVRIISLSFTRPWERIWGSLFFLQMIDNTLNPSFFFCELQQHLLSFNTSTFYDWDPLLQGFPTCGTRTTSGTRRCFIFWKRSVKKYQVVRKISFWLFGGTQLRKGWEPLDYLDFFTELDDQYFQSTATWKLEFFWTKIWYLMKKLNSR